MPPRGVPRGSQSYERDVQSARTRKEMAAVYPRNRGIPATPFDKLPEDEGRPSNAPVRIPLLNPVRIRVLERMLRSCGVRYFHPNVLFDISPR